MYFNVEIELIKKNGKNVLFIANDGSSGCEYEFKTKEELAKLINGYVEDLVEYEVDLDEIEESEDEDWEEEFLVRVHDIDYCIELEDLESNGFDTENMSDVEIDAAIQKIVDTLPEELTVEVECTREDLEEVVCDTISEETGWLVNGFEYDILEA